MRGLAGLRFRKEVESLLDVQKLQLIDALLIESDKPDPEIDRVWADEAHRRWKAYKAGQIKTIPYRGVMKQLKVG